LNRGQGILEKIIGIDYMTLKQNADYKLYPKKLDYKAATGKCVQVDPKAKGPRGGDSFNDQVIP